MAVRKPVKIPINGVRSSPSLLRMPISRPPTVHQREADNPAAIDQLRRGAEVAGGRANPAGGGGEGVRGAGEGDDEAGDGVGADGVRTCEAHVGEGSRGS